MRRRALSALLAGVCLCLAAGAVALAQGVGPKPMVSDVTSTSAQVSAVVKPPGDVGAYHLEWGTDESYGSSSDPVALGVEPGARKVGGTLTGLQPATTYWVRVVVTGRGDPVVTRGVAFTTAAGPTPTPVPPAPAQDTGGGAQVVPAETVQTSPPDPDAAEQGESVVLGPESGEVTVKQSGTDAYATVHAGTPVPVGSSIDSSAGTVRLISATAGDATQDILLRGAKFQVRQARDGSGITELVLKGGDFHACRRARSSSKRTREKARRSLWAKDRGGRFRTRGRNSVATVRGTTWRTTDTCVGTTTSVSSGSVIVREQRGGRKVLVRKGGHHLARARR
jgi:hypothetical protein